MNKRNKHIPKDVYVHGCRIYAEDGNVKIDYSDETQKNGGDVTPDELKEILLAVVKMTYETS